MTRLLGVRAVHLADLVLLALLAEAALLSLHPRLRRALPPRTWLPGWTAGAFLALALRTALSGASPSWTALFLALAFPARLFDLALRRSAPEASPVTPAAAP